MCKLMLTAFIFPETKEEGEWYNLNWAKKHQRLVKHIKYIITTSDWILQLVLINDKIKKNYSISKQSYKFK